MLIMIILIYVAIKKNILPSRLTNIGCYDLCSIYTTFYKQLDMLLFFTKDNECTHQRRYSK